MIKKDKYNVCLIGALAQISPLHVEGIKSISQFNLCAVCDIDRKKLREIYPQLPENSLLQITGKLFNLRILILLLLQLQTSCMP